LQQRTHYISEYEHTVSRNIQIADNIN